MNGFTAPVSMLAAKGGSGVIVAGVIGLLIVLALSAQRDPTAAIAQNRR
jgi:hypothetical protein